MDNTYVTLKKMVPQIKEILNGNLPSGPIEVKGNNLIVCYRLNRGH